MLARYSSSRFALAWSLPSSTGAMNAPSAAVVPSASTLIA